MLETEEVDDDFFTPVAGTSLANIFGSASSNKESTQNDSLRYVPPKPQNIVTKKKEQAKNSECIYACTVTGHEWFNNVYTSRGRLGFAIVKILKTGDHNIVLYDSNKTTLSSVLISTKFEVTVRNNSYISYYDNQQKYWSIYGTEETINTITDMLKTWGVNIIFSTYIDKGPPEPKNETETNVNSKDNELQNIESDTDSSVNKKTKASILNRMANMGHSVLPMRAPPAELSSDSSEAVEAVIKTARHKPIKTSTKRTSIENIAYEHQNLTEEYQKIKTANSANTESDRHVAVYNSQFIPLTNTSGIAGTSNELGMFMTEQRVSNSELRININRITDKMDLVLKSLSNLENKENNSNVSSDVMLKLLTEYENKIKVYEETIKSKNNIYKKNIDELKHSHTNDEVELLKNKISQLENENVEKCIQLSVLQGEINLLKDKHCQDNQIHSSKINDQLSKINSLENDIKTKDKEITDLKMLSNTKISNNNIEEKVKNIMNDTFQTISTNFENDENYSGETIKRIIGTVIKKITIQTLSEL